MERVVTKRTNSLSSRG